MRVVGIRRDTFWQDPEIRCGRTLRERPVMKAKTTVRKLPSWS